VQFKRKNGQLQMMKNLETIQDMARIELTCNELIVVSTDLRDIVRSHCPKCKKDGDACIVTLIRTAIDD